MNSSAIRTLDQSGEVGEHDETLGGDGVVVFCRRTVHRVVHDEAGNPECLRQREGVFELCAPFRRTWHATPQQASDCAG